MEMGILDLKRCSLSNCPAIVSPCELSRSVGHALGLSCGETVTGNLSRGGEVSSISQLSCCLWPAERQPQVGASALRRSSSVSSALAIT
jgi:hypothetical protein